MKFCPDMPDEVGGMVRLLNSQVVRLQDLQLQGCGSNPPANVTADFTMTRIYSRLVESHFLDLCSSFKS